MTVTFAAVGPGEAPPDADALQAAIVLDPGNARLHHTLGIALLLRNDVAGAVASLERSIALEPGDPLPHCSLGQVHLLRQNLDGAQASFEQAIALDPEELDARCQLAVVLLARGRTRDAVRMLTDLAEHHPEAPLLWANLAAARRADGDADGAVDACRKAVALRPDFPAFRRDLGAMLYGSGRFSEAVAERRRLVELDPESGEAVNDLAATLYANGEMVAALAGYERAAELAPRWSVPLHNAALAAAHLGDVPRAVELLRRAVLVNPAARPCHLDLGIFTMMLGDYTEGLREYEWRWTADGAPCRRPELEVPLWDGRPLAGRSLLLWSEQGLGDILQFVRFTDRIPKDGGRIILHAPKNLAGLLATCPGVDQVVMEGDRLDVHVQFPLVSLPFLLGATLETLGDTPYLHAPQPCPAAEAWVPRDGSLLNVGCVWASGPLSRRHRTRDINVHAMAALSTIPGVRLFSLQFGPRAIDAEPYRDHLIDLSQQIGDFARTAAFVERMDLIVTVDTSMAHLAGALGAPVWLLLPQQADWRWLAGRADSPWYPTMRLYRQSRPGDWTEPMAELRRDLTALAGDRPGAARAPRPLPARPASPPPVYIKQWGERRTGTNYLRALLTANYHAEVLMHILGDKHSPPVPFARYWEEAQGEPDPAKPFVWRATFSAPAATTSLLDLRQAEEAAQLAAPIAEAFVRDELRYVISLRDPYAWAVSLGWFLGWSKRGTPLPAARADELREHCRKFNERHAAWLRFAEASPGRALFVRYEELLAEPESVCERLARAWGLVRRSSQWRNQNDTVLPANWDDGGTVQTGTKFVPVNDPELFLPEACRAAIAETAHFTLEMYSASMP